MKKYLLSPNGSFYKANLHMHTTVSDGKFTPEETKKAYIEKGYSVVAYTDHEVMVSHEELTDEKFVAITGVEFSVKGEDAFPWQYGGNPVYHFNLYAKDPKNVISSVFSERYIVFKNSIQYVTEEMKKYDDEREYSQAYINDAIRRAKEEGFLVSYNHPVWSQQSYPDYCDLKGLWGLEVYNTGCVRNGYPDTPQPLDDLLKTNQQVFPLATDDSHNQKDRFGGWVMLNAKELTYENVIKAMENGDFYASTGPEIKEISIEDGILKIYCSEAVEIMLSTQRRYAKNHMAQENETIESAEFDIREHLERSKEIFKTLGERPYIRITVKDKYGKCAYSRAYFYEELT